ncbi:MAG: fibronectin type III domain-containing protein [Anaerolineaceae bacterium]|nr:fibronectin type III domain-containing protein [Anaerolineaceae bacterium]
MEPKRRFLDLLRHSQGVLFLAVLLVLLGRAPAQVQAASNSPYPPTLTAPADRANVSTMMPTFSWAAVPGATNYFIEISADPLFGSSTLDGYTTAATFIPDSAKYLKYGMTYYWRVTAYENGWSSTASVARRFTVTLQQSPSDGAFVTKPQITFAWNAAPGAIFYQFYWSQTTPINFGNNPTFTTGKTTLITTNLTADGPWFWAVCVYLRSGQRECPVYAKNVNPWVVTLTSGLPPAPTLSLPPKGYFFNYNQPELKWNAVPVGTPDFPFNYQVQIDTHADFSQPSCDQTVVTLYFDLSTTWCNLYDGKYNWRVRAVNQTGSAGKWSPVWQFTIDTVSPIPPALLSPADYSVSTASPKIFKWSKSSSDTISYELVVTSGNSTVLDETNLQGTSYPLTKKDPVLGAGDYQWYVTARDAAGNSNHTQNPFDFQIVTSLPPVPAVPALTTPAANGHINDPSFAWTLVGDPAVTAGLSSEIQVDDVAGFSEPTSYMLDDQTILPGDPTSVTLDPSILPDQWLDDPTGPYYWRVRAFDASSGYSSQWSAVRTFWFNNTPPNQPALLAPSEEAALSQLNPTFSWSPVPGAVKYDLQITDNSVSLPVVHVFKATSYTPPGHGLPYFGPVSWNLTAADAYGNLSQVSDDGTFTIYIQNTPAQGAIVTVARPNFKWSAYPGASSYNLIVKYADSLKTFFNVPVSGTNYTPPGNEALGPGKYVWQVVVNGAANPPTPPDNWVLYIKPSLPAAPTLISPANNALIGSAGQKMDHASWSNVAFEDHFELEISTSPKFILAVPVILPGNDVDYTITNPNLLPSTSGVYYWRVRGVNSDGAGGSWSSVHTFTLDLLRPAAPFLLSPASGGSVTNSHLMLTWSAISDAVAYDLVISPTDLPLPSDPAFPLPTHLGKVTSYKLPTTLGEGHYYWTVQAYDAAGNPSGYAFPQDFYILAGLNVPKPSPTPTVTIEATLTATPAPLATDAPPPAVTPTPIPAEPTEATPIPPATPTAAAPLATASASPTEVESLVPTETPVPTAATPPAAMP